MVIFDIVWVDNKIIGIIIPRSIAVIKIHDVLIARKIGGIMICCRCDWLVLLIVGCVRIIIPDMFICLLFLLSTFRFHLFYLLPIELNAIHLYFFEDLIACLSKYVWRLALSSENFTITMYLRFRLLCFNMIFFPLNIKRALFAINSCCSSTFVPFYERP